ncbi:MAG: hypothetical protein K8F52_10435 [Candidatus Scalindua rubra]|uniref:DUF202 domain-containing protein n=1 Tax=Candidatus Scalindua brodae TaxID=237368 RepID=A0A0B0EI57_9BACT|nr:MAG: hypothetical protein SCABRO_02027 [Candidatus Scalindua brodae]MBZ0109076.1 hypothetical protein [Candidatus Scalindua rubra]
MDIIELSREALYKELETKNHRINWLLVTQSLIVAAFGVASKLLSENKSDQTLQLLLKYAPVLGASLAALSFIGITGCYIAIYNLNKHYKKLINEDENVETLRILIFKGRCSGLIGVIYSYLLCVLFLYMWYMIWSNINA